MTSIEKEKAGVNVPMLVFIAALCVVSAVAAGLVVRYLYCRRLVAQQNRHFEESKDYESRLAQANLRNERLLELTENKAESPTE
ncbi:MAG: hypothetical protein QM669_12380 [Siphonobacter sp.]